MQEVLDFIKRRFPIDCRWLDGNCYYFALLLQMRFGGNIYYDYLIGHFYLKFNCENYDYGGIYKPQSEIPLDELKEKDPTWYNRLVNDCIL